MGVIRSKEQTQNHRIRTFRVFRVVRGLMFSSEIFLTTDHTKYTEYV